MLSVLLKLMKNRIHLGAAKMFFLGSTSTSRFAPKRQSKEEKEKLSTAVVVDKYSSKYPEVGSASESLAVAASAFSIRVLLTCSCC